MAWKSWSIAVLAGVACSVTACNALLGIRELDDSNGGPDGAADRSADAPVNSMEGGPVEDGDSDGARRTDGAVDATTPLGDATAPGDATMPQGDSGPGDSGPDGAPPSGSDGGCGTGLVACDGGCVSFGSIHTCGSCTNDCAALSHVDVTSLACSAGRCSYGCQGGYADCGDAGAGCVTSLSSSPTCGACSGVCSANTACGQTSAGGPYACLSTCPTSAPTLCGSGSSSQCVDERTNDSNCGGCGPTFACSGGKTCLSSQCQTQLGVTRTAFSATQGVAFSGTVATVVDAIASDTPSALTAEVDWGDGTTSSGTMAGTPGSFAVSAAHTYATSGSLTVTVTVSDAATGAVGSAALAANVGVCTPGAKRCSSATPQLCDSTGAWQDQTPCTNGFTCSSGTCACSLTVCGSSCVNPNVDTANCGSCGNSCVGACSAGKCQCVTPGGTNLIKNGGFDTNVAGWTALDPDIVLSFASLDAAECTTSGSVLATNQAPNGLNSGFLQCVPVTAGQAYDVGAWTRIPSGGAQGQTFVQMAWFTGAGCTGSLTLATLLSASNTFDTWQLLSQDNLVAPAGTVSAYVYGQIIKNFPNTLPYQSYYDMMYLSPAPGHF